jgi:apolipoprotein N-acyltransferase
MIKVFIALSIMCMCLAPKISTATKFKGISTNFGKIESDLIRDYERQQSLIARTRAAKDKIVVLPEGVTAFDWNEISKNLWSRSLHNKTVIIGTSINKSDAEKKDNALVVMAPGKYPDIYRQRQPIPLSMWRPFLSDGYNANWFASPTLELEGSNTKLAPLICYEGFLVWPVAESVLFGANQIIAVGNFWWTDGKTIPTIHKSIITAWSRLFAIPATLAVNL